jgi:hypothetical protein
MDILVDGSNVLFWRGGQADASVPLLVIRALSARRFTPLVYFDQSIHRHLGAAALEQVSYLCTVTIAPRGTFADELLLEACGAGRRQIVSCDRFEAWRRLYPALRADWCVTGCIAKGGRVSFSKKLRPAPL